MLKKSPNIIPMVAPIKLRSPLWIAIIAWSLGCSSIKNYQPPSLDIPFTNLHQVDQDLYRSEQPNKIGMEHLEKIGVKTILNLRHIRSDKNEACNTKLTIEQVHINTWTIKYEEVVEALKIIRDAKKPVLVHCKHGSDRTGCVVAAYRMVFDNWSKQKAIEEFLQPQYGYHAKLFPRILKILEDIDIEQLRTEVGA